MMRLIVEYVSFLELTDENALSLDAAVSQQELVARTLRDFPDEDLDQLRAYTAGLADATQDPRYQEFLRRLPDALGLPQTAVIFRCASCAAELTSPMREVSLPAQPPASDVEQGEFPPLMPLDAFAVDAEPFGAPYTPPIRALDGTGILTSGGPRGSIVLHPANVRGLRWRQAADPLASRALGLQVSLDSFAAVKPHPDNRRVQGCCGPSGTQGPNLVCGTCDVEIATICDDCGTWPFVRLQPEVITKQPVRTGSTPR
jgi:hypothetical protein